MKKTITDPTRYVFDASNQTVQLLDYTSINLAGLLLIVNTNTNTIIYSLVTAGSGGTVAGNVVTLDYNTTAMSDNDPLQIIYDDSVNHPVTIGELTSQNLGVVDRPIEEAFSSTREFGDAREQPSMYDLFDVSSEMSQPLPVAPAGIDTPGQRTGAQSFPVVLPPEQVNDQYIVGFGLNAGNLNGNILSPVPPGTVSPWTDCTLYKSIFIQINTAGSTTGAITFEGSNDGINAVAVQMFDIAAPATLPVTNFTLATNTYRFWGGPLQFKYFRARVSTVLAAGATQAFAMLRLAPFSPIQQYAQTNMATLAGTAPVNAGVAGTLAVGGNIANATAPTIKPLLAGAQDNTGAVTTSAPTVAIPASPTIATGLTRTLLTDTLGDLGVTTPISLVGTQVQLANPVAVVGSRVGTTQGQYTPVRVSEDNNEPQGTNVAALLYGILVQLKAIAFYLRELPPMINQNQTFIESPADIAEAFSQDTNQIL